MPCLSFPESFSTDGNTSCIHPRAELILLADNDVDLLLCQPLKIQGSFYMSALDKRLVLMSPALHLASLFPCPLPGPCCAVELEHPLRGQSGSSKENKL